MERKKVTIDGFPIREQWLPLGMWENKYAAALIKAKSVKKFFNLITKQKDANPTEAETELIVKQFVRIRCLYDFPFWAATFVSIKKKGGGGDMRFRLNHAQRVLVTEFEKQRTEGRPIRLVLLKARQWGGSTATQIYMAWLQLVHKKGLNSLIVGHVKSVAYEVKDMFDKVIKEYPLDMLHALDEDFADNEPKIMGVGQSGDIHRIPQRNCKIKVGSYENPDSARGGDYNLVHCTEVGLWSPTLMKTPEAVVRSATSGIALRPYTMIVYESTANGTGNFFEHEYTNAKRGNGQYKALFIPWYMIEWDSLPLTPEEERKLATELWENRHNEYTPDNRREPGKYLWYLWECGATLQGIAWYISERTKYTDHGDMASECPTDDNEAFTYSGFKVFDKLRVEKLRGACKPPRFVGDVYADGDEGKAALSNVRFIEDKTGQLCVWDKPEVSPTERITNRYLVVVDIGGRSAKADWSVICVFDRLFLMDGDRPEVVAQWYGHIDMDLLAWKAAQIAQWYDNALLVIESNTLETKDRDRIVTDTLRDSVYIREVVTTEGKTVYVEKNTSRDHKAQTITKHDTVFVRVNETAKSDIAQTEVVETKTTSRPFAPYILILAVGLLIGIAIELYKYLKQR